MFRRLIIALGLLGVLLLLIPAPAEAAGHTVRNGYTLALASWPTILAGLCGVGSAELTAFFTHHTAPQWIKSGMNLALTTLAGVLITITTVPGYTWKDYLSEIAVAWIVALGTHFAGLTAFVGNSTYNVGIGAGARPLVSPPPAAGTTTGGVF